MASTDSKGKVAVVLSGGGGKGAYQVGVLKAMRARGIDPDIYCGTSVGSFNAAMLASGRTLEDVERVWLDITRRNIFELRYDPRRVLSLNPRVPLQFAFSSARMLGAFIAETLRSGGRWWEAVDLDSFLVDTTPLERLIRDNVDIAALRAGAKEICIALTLLKPSEGDALRIFPRAEITHRHILASCSLPLIFPPVSIGDRVYCDGGVVMNNPLKPAIRAGAEEIYAIDLTPPPRMYEDATLPLAYQVMSAQFNAALQRDLEYAEQLNCLYLAAYTEGRLKEDQFELPLMNTHGERAGQLTHKSYRYLRLYVLRPASDLGGIGGFLKFDPVTAARFIEAGEREGAEALDRHFEKEMEAPDGRKMRAVLRQRP